MHKRDKQLAVIAWCSYDWANSGYTTLLITVFVIYIQRIVFGDQEQTGALVWAWGIAISMLIGAIISPFAGAVADQLSAKRLGLGITSIGGGCCCILIGLFPSLQPWIIVVLFVMANLGLELSLTFYNGFLPEIADENELDSVSAKGFAAGYFGGGLALLGAMVILSAFESIPLASRLRVCIFGTGVWWIVFSIPTLIWLRDKRSITNTVKPEVGKTFSDSIANTSRTLIEIKRTPELFWFLIAFLVYNDGIQTVISQSSTFALQEIEFSESGLVAVVLLIQFLATPGALLAGWLSRKFGRRRVLLWNIFTWIALLFAAWFVIEPWQFWCLAIGVAVVLGGTQSISRSIMGSLTPVGCEARYFGFFNFSGKATSFLGTFFFGAVVAFTGNSRYAIVGLILFFVAGFSILLTKVKPKP